MGEEPAAPMPDEDEVEPRLVEPGEPVVRDPEFALGAGCIAGEPEVVDPEPEAVGRSVPADGGAWAKAGAATKAVAMRQAAMCFLSIKISWRGCLASAQALRANAASRAFVPTLARLLQ
jgi:hypothetical protein